MTCARDLLSLATKYHQALPARIRRYLYGRGIPDLLIDFHLLGWNGWRITIPIFDRDGGLAFFKLARDPEDPIPGPKMLVTLGGHAELYGWEVVRKKPAQIVICEGEFDRLVLEAKGFFAVTSTGGAGVFREEWAREFAGIPEVYVCFDNDDAGRRGADRVGRLIPHARVVELPEEVGPGGDVTDFFVRLGRTRAQFEELLAQAMTLPPAPEKTTDHPASLGSTLLRERIERIKSAVAIAGMVERYVKLKPTGDRLVGVCPFHEEREPSFTVFPATGSFYCFGCQEHGDVITFLQRMEHLSFSQVLDRLDSTLPPAPLGNADQ